MPLSELGEAALGYARRGWAVFPLLPGTKEPATMHGFKDASTDSDRVVAWWTKGPDCNVGIACGQVSGGLVVIDLDTHGEGNSGVDNLKAWEADNGELPRTVTSDTGSGGVHLLFESAEEVRNSSNAALKVDVRGDGGYIVAPPSVHPNGNRYMWRRGLTPANLDLAPFEGLAHLFAMSTRGAVKGEKFEWRGVGEGGRNNELFRLGCSLRAKGLTDSLIASTIEGYNQAYNPPLGTQEVDKIIRSVLALPAGHSEEFEEQRKNEHKDRFNHAKAAARLINEHGACSIDGAPACYENGHYSMGWDSFDRALVEMYPGCKINQRKEAREYARLSMPKKEQSSPNLILFENGVLDIDTMELREPTDSDVIPNVIPHRWIPDAECAVVDETLARIGCDDVDTIMDLYEVMGVCMYRSNSLGQAAVLLGTGSNGKSTFIRMLRSLLGQENVSSLDLSTLGGRFYTGQLLGKLANLGDDISNEFQHGDLLAVFKKVATGERVYADVKGAKGFEFSPYCTMVFSANEMPRLADHTNGVMRRLFPIDFNAVFKRSDPGYDPDIEAKVTSEGACERMAVLAVTGLKAALADHGFTPTKASARRLEEIQLENDTVAMWAVDNGYTAKELDGQPILPLYEAYDEWAKSGNLRPVTRRKFSSSLIARYALSSVTAWDAHEGKNVRVFKLEGRPNYDGA